MSRALFCSSRMTMGTGGAVYHHLSEMANSEATARLGSGAQKTLLRNYFALPPLASLCTHILASCTHHFPLNQLITGSLFLLAHTVSTCVATVEHPWLTCTTSN